jgi:xanthine/uracil/vitamin C permease (AzgA family)
MENLDRALTYSIANGLAFDFITHSLMKLFPEKSES